jgi:hypothetical protein
MYTAMGPAVHAGLRDIKCVRVPHAVNPNLPHQQAFWRVPCLARGPVAGSKFSPHPGKKNSPGRHSHTHQTLTPN